MSMTQPQLPEVSDFVDRFRCSKCGSSFPLLEDLIGHFDTCALPGFYPDTAESGDAYDLEISVG